MKTYLILLVVILCSSLTISTHAQTDKNPYLKFTTLDTLPYIQEWPATVTDGKSIYSINGYSPVTKNPLLLKYDPETDGWFNASKHYSFALQSAAAYFPGTDRAYIFGGIRPKNSFAFPGVAILDLKTGLVHISEAFNPMPASYACAKVWKNKIYIFGGTLYNKRTTASLYSFDPQTNGFNQLASMPQKLQTTGEIIDGVLYTIGGYNDSKREGCDSIYAYDIAKNTWSGKYKLPITLTANSTVAYGNLIFVIGDYHKENFIGYYDTANNTFIRLKSNMKDHRAAGAAIIGHTLYVFGGKTDPGRPTGGSKNMQSADLSELIQATGN